VKVLDHNTNEHVEYEEGDEQQERDKVQQAPLVVVSFWLQTQIIDQSRIIHSLNQSINQS